MIWLFVAGGLGALAGSAAGIAPAKLSLPARLQSCHMAARLGLVGVLAPATGAAGGGAGRGGAGSLGTRSPGQVASAHAWIAPPTPHPMQVVPTFCLLSLGYLYSSRWAGQRARQAASRVCNRHGLRCVPRLRAGPHGAAPPPSALQPSNTHRSVHPPPLCRREVDSVVLPYLNRARLSYAARAFLTSGAWPRRAGLG